MNQRPALVALLLSATLQLTLPALAASLRLPVETRQTTLKVQDEKGQPLAEVKVRIESAAGTSLGAATSSVDGAVNSFVMAAAIELPRAIRINAVCPGLLQDSAQWYDGYFPGHEPVSSARVGLGYAKSVEGAITGQVILVI